MCLAVTCATAAPQLAWLIAAGLAWVAVGIAAESALAIAVFLVLVVRPSLDAFSGRTLGTGAFYVNPAVVVGAGVALAAVRLAISRGRRGLPVWPSSRLRTAHVWLAGAYVVAALSGALLYGGAGLSLGLRELTRLSGVVGAFLLVAWWVTDDPRRVTRGWTFVAFGVVPPVATACWQLATGTGYSETEGLNRLQGTFAHPNTLALFLTPLCVVAVAAALLNSAGRRFWLGLSVAIAILVALTSSRTGLLCLVIGSALVPFLGLWHSGGRELRRALATLALMLGAAWLAVGGAVRLRFGNLSTAALASQAIENASPENSLEWRVVNWTTLVRMGLQHPWLGHGAGMTEVLNPIVNQNTGIPFNAHDDFVRFFFEAGVIGLACYCLYGVWLTVWLVGRLRQPRVEARPVVAGVAATFVAMFFLTAGTPELSLQTAVQYLLYGLIALSLPTLPREAPHGPAQGAAHDRSTSLQGQKDASS